MRGRSACSLLQNRVVVRHPPLPDSGRSVVTAGRGANGARGRCGVAHALPFSRARARSLVREVSAALKLRPGDAPSFAVLLGSPGDEEIVLDGMQAALGDATPILGGSSADNAVVGAWRQIAKVGTSNFTVGAPTTSGSGITICVAWASCETATILTSGFRQTDKRGVVTKARDFC